MKLIPISSVVVRLYYSILALGSAWIISGALYALKSWTFWQGGVIPYGDRIYLVWLQTRSWLALTGVFCIVGWLLVGIPVVALGKKVLNKPFWFVTLTAGFSGAGIMLIPTLLGTGGGKELLHWDAWIFCEIAFAIAAGTMALYRLFLELNTRAPAA